MQIGISPSENYLPDAITPLIEELNGHGAEVIQVGVYRRHSAGDLPPAIIMAAAFAAAAVGTGFLNAMGADAWAVLKQVVGRAAASRHHSKPPTIILEVTFDDCEIVLWQLSDASDLSERLDKALLRLDQIGQCVDLWYEAETDEWLTVDELLLSKSRKPGSSSRTE